jgi:hypothetical protein
MSHRRIALGDDCYLLLHVNVRKPRSLPEVRFLGTDGKLDRLITNWRKYCKKWYILRFLTLHAVHMSHTKFYTDMLSHA